MFGTHYFGKDEPFRIQPRASMDHNVHGMIHNVPTIDHVHHALTTVTQQIPLSIEKQEFMNSLSLLKNLNPPNAITCLESLFKTPKHSLPIQSGIIQNNILFINPFMKLIQKENHDEFLEVSLLTLIQLEQDRNHVLQLDLRVIKATLFT